MLSIPLTFAPGSGSADMCAFVTVNRDNMVERDEEFSITLTLTSELRFFVLNSNTAVTLTDSDGKYTTW